MESVDEDSGSQSDDAESRLPALSEGQGVDATELTPEGHTTNPPARYTEASLVKALEELGIGRPSTYASIIKTILDRGYVYKRGNALVPSWVAFAVIGLLEPYFGRLVDFDFTAAMEDDLDAIAWARTARTGCPASTSAATTAWRIDRPHRWPEEDGRRAARRHRRPRGQLDQAVRRRQGARTCGSGASGRT